MIYSRHPPSVIDTVYHTSVPEVGSETDLVDSWGGFLKAINSTWHVASENQFNTLIGVAFRGS